MDTRFRPQMDVATRKHMPSFLTSKQATIDRDHTSRFYYLKSINAQLMHHYANAQHLPWCSMNKCGETLVCNEGQRWFNEITGEYSTMCRDSLIMECSHLTCKCQELHRAQQSSNPTVKRIYKFRQFINSERYETRAFIGNVAIACGFYPTKDDDWHASDRYLIMSIDVDRAISNYLRKGEKADIIDEVILLM